MNKASSPLKTLSLNLWTLMEEYLKKLLEEDNWIQSYSFVKFATLEL